jgi:hypothetical protein
MLRNFHLPKYLDPEYQLAFLYWNLCLMLSFFAKFLNMAGICTHNEKTRYLIMKKALKPANISSILGYSSLHRNKIFILHQAFSCVHLSACH